MMLISHPQRPSQHGKYSHAYTAGHGFQHRQNNSNYNCTQTIINAIKYCMIYINFVLESIVHRASRVWHYKNKHGFLKIIDRRVSAYLNCPKTYYNDKKLL